MHIGLLLNIYSQNGLIIETTKLYILIPVWVISTCIQGHSCKNNHFCAYFLTDFQNELDEIQSFATTCWFAGTHATFSVQD